MNLKEKIIHHNIITLKHKINPHINQILNKTDFLNDILQVNENIHIALYLIYNDIDSLPKCKNCRKTCKI